MNRTFSLATVCLCAWLVLALAPAAYAVLAGGGVEDLLRSVAGWLGMAP